MVIIIPLYSNNKPLDYHFHFKSRFYSKHTTLFYQRSSKQKNPGQVDFVWDNNLELVRDLGFASLDLAHLIALLEVALEVDPFSEGVLIAELKTLGDLYKAYQRVK